MKPITTTMNKIAVDTNILIYLHETSDSIKRDKSFEIMKSFPVIPAQVISEYLNVLKRILKVPKIRLIEHCIIATDECEIAPVNKRVLQKASFLISRYDFQLFDAIIVASALESNCGILYSEDLQHNQLIENRLRVINPFL